jgi:hypothetical protein
MRLRSPARRRGKRQGVIEPRSEALVVRKLNAEKVRHYVDRSLVISTVSRIVGQRIDYYRLMVDFYRIYFPLLTPPKCQ